MLEAVEAFERGIRRDWDSSQLIPSLTPNRSSAIRFSRRPFCLEPREPWAPSPRAASARVRRQRLGTGRAQPRGGICAAMDTGRIRRCAGPPLVELTARQP
jgi:hypothetical protein